MGARNARLAVGMAQRHRWRRGLGVRSDNGESLPIEGKEAIYLKFDERFELQSIKIRRRLGSHVAVLTEPEPGMVTQYFGHRFVTIHFAPGVTGDTAFARSV